MREKALALPHWWSGAATERRHSQQTAGATGRGCKSSAAGVPLPLKKELAARASARVRFDARPNPSMSVVFEVCPGRTPILIHGKCAWATDAILATTVSTLIWTRSPMSELAPRLKVLNEELARLRAAALRLPHRIALRRGCDLKFWAPFTLVSEYFPPAKPFKSTLCSSPRFVLRQP